MAVTITQTWIDDVVSSGNSQFDLNGDTTYELTEDIVISTSNCRYFNMNGTGIVFNGNGHKVTMHNIFGFFGFVITCLSSCYVCCLCLLNFFLYYVC